MATTKKMTIKYWNSLPADSRARAIEAAFPNGRLLAENLKNREPDLKSSQWRLIFKLVRIPMDGCSYKTAVNGWLIP